MHPIASAVLITWRRNGGYGSRLVGDLTDSQFFAQPAPGAVMNHPAWILAHLNLYPPVIAALLRRETVVDPLGHKFGQNSKVLTDPAEYPAPAVLKAEFERMHALAEKALVESDETVFAEANPIERQRERHPTIGDMIVTLTVKHEAGHLGQLSAWRRAMRLPSVPM